MLGHASTRPRSKVGANKLDLADEAVLELERAWSLGTRPSVEAIWARFSPTGSVDILAALIKAKIRCRFQAGEEPNVAEYLERFSLLGTVSDRVVSLVYEEYCLREERGEQLDPEEFCTRYDPWRDSLLSQLRYHRMLSQAAGVEPSTSRLPAAGERFRSFRLRSVLGQGGTARVFLANDESLGDRVVALKVSTDRGKEPAIQGRLDHAHIVPVLSVTDDPETGLRGLCMPYRPGLALDKVIQKVDPASRPRKAAVLREVVARANSSNPPEDIHRSSWKGFPARGTYAEGIAWIVSVVARALAYAHGENVQHRDIKPANVLLTERDGPQLLDFNLAHSSQTADQAEAAHRGGTLPYMAPEQLEAFLDPQLWNNVREPADIYALGLLLRELLTGRRPESPDQSLPMPRAIRDLLDRRAIGLGSVRTLNPSVPHGLDAIVARCLAFRPEDRYSSASALADDLERFVTHRPMVEVVNPSRLERATGHARRLRVGRAALIALALTVVGGAFAAMSTPKTVESYMKDAEVLAEKGNPVAVHQLINTVLKLEPNSWHIRSRIAHLYREMKQGTAAVKESEMAIQLAKSDKNVTPNLLAQLYHRKGAIALFARDYAKSALAFRQAVETEEYFFSSYDGLADIALIQKNYEEAEKSLTEALKAFQKAKAKGLALDADAAKPAIYHRKLALVQLNLGNSIPRAPGVGGELQARGRADHDRAMAHFLQAKNDLAIAQKLLPSPSNEEAFAQECVAAQMEVAFGDSFSEVDDYARAVDRFEKARVLLDRAIKRGIEAPEAKGLSREIDLRLKSDRPKLDDLLRKKEARPRPPG